MSSEQQPTATAAAQPFCAFQALLICNTYKRLGKGELDGPLTDGQNLKEWLLTELARDRSAQERTDIASCIRLCKNVKGAEMSEEVKSLGNRVKSLKEKGEAPVVRAAKLSNSFRFPGVARAPNASSLIFRTSQCGKFRTANA